MILALINPYSIQEALHEPLQSIKTCVHPFLFLEMIVYFIQRFTEDNMGNFYKAYFTVALCSIYINLPNV